MKREVNCNRQFRWLLSLIGMFILLWGTVATNAQEYESLLKSDSIFNDTIDHLIISEWRGDQWQGSYIELTNMGDTAIDLRKMGVRALPGGKQSWDFWSDTANNETMAILFDSLKLSKEDYTLDPGEVFLMAPHYDALTDDGGFIHRPELIEKADYIGYKIEKSVPNDTSSYGERFFRQWGSYPVGVFVATRVADTLPPFYKEEWVLVDNVNGDRDPLPPNNIGNGFDNVAGFPEATNEAILVRKHTVTKGTREGEWRNAASDDITTSEWIPIKHDDENPGGKIFKTAGNHGDFMMDVAGGPGVTVDLVNGMLKVPWGALRAEKIIDKEVILGDGMAWTYRNYSEEGDSLLDINDLSFNRIAMPGDVIKLYACGDELETVELTIEYADPALDAVEVHPTHRKNEEGEWAEYFSVTAEETVMDTIGNVPFATRTDTIVKYLDIASNSTWEFVFVDGKNRADLVHGDILQITGANGTSQKQYFIDVQDYEGSIEARLSTIKWPDIFLQGPNIPYYLQNGWASGSSLSDTLPGFSSGKESYIITLAEGTEDVPALSVTPMDLNAVVEIERATDLNGSFDDRQTTIRVSSEDGSTLKTYSVLFEVFSDKIQEFNGEPFFSTRMMTITTRNSGLEVVNPRNVDLELSNYLIVKTDKHYDWVKAIQDTVEFFSRYNKYIPGYVYKAKDTTVWNQAKDYTMTKGGPNIDSKIAPGDVFVMGNLHNKQAKWWKSIAHTQEIDVIFHPKEALVDPYYPDKSIYSPEEFDIAGASGGQPVNQQQHVGYSRAQHSVFLFRIENDSILAGTKSIHDTLDFTLIDVIADPTNSPNYVLGSWDENGDSSRVWTVTSGSIIMLREPDINKGVSKAGDGISADREECQWIVGDEDYWPEVDGRWSGMTQHFGTHKLNTIAVHYSTITSSIYLVSSGFEEVQDVKGIVSGTTVEQFIDNITKADTGQSLQFIAGGNGAELGLSDVLENGDSLIVASADSSNFTRYLLEVTAAGLKDDASLSSTAYTVSGTSDTTGIVDGIVYGTTLKDVRTNVQTDVDARLTIIDGNNQVVGLNEVTADGQIVLRTATSDIYFEVIAQDKVTRKVYQLNPTVLSSDAYVLSDVYVVSDFMVEGITSGIGVDAFLMNIIAVGGEYYVETKSGQQRTSGILAYDDLLVVVSEDKTVTAKYELVFIGVVLNQAPVIDLVEDINANVGVLFNIAAIVTDDGLPEGSTLVHTWTVTSGNDANVNIATPDAATTDVTISAEGEYVLELSVSDGEKESKASVNVSATPVGISSRQSTSLQFYPNPSRGKVYIGGLRTGSIVTVYDRRGSAVDIFDTSDGKHIIDLENQPAGTYIIHVLETNGTFRIGKVVKH